MADLSTTPFAVDRYDNPETIRLRKYATGAHLVLEGNGIETGRTPKELVWAKDKVRLYRYEPAAEKQSSVPVLLVYALILRPYVLDLVPGNSLVEYLVNEGFDVYLLDWGVPDDEDRDLSFENHVLDYMPGAVEQVLSNSSAEELTLFGYCQGGTMSVMYASLFPGKPLKNLVLLATPVDFAPDNPGLFGLWSVLTSGKYFDPDVFFNPDLVVETFGNFPADVPSRFTDAATSTLKPLADYYASVHARLWENIEQKKAFESFLAVSKWLDDGVPFAGEAFRRWIRDFYYKNKLAKGELELRGRLVDLSNIEVPLLNIAGEKDYICPLSQAKPTMDLVGSEDREMLVLDAGHVGLMASPVAKNELWPRIRDWLEPRSE
jgi:polyhydroxyalkanoate synthase